MKTFVLTIGQIKDIFRAGIRRGEDTATAYDWGSVPSGKEFDELTEALHEIVNAGVGDWEKQIHYEEIESWLQERK